MLTPAAKRPRRRRLVKAPEREWRNTHCWLLTCGTRGRAPLFAADAALAQSVLHSADAVAHRHGFVLDAMCVMPDHVHLLLQAQDRTRDDPAAFLTAWRAATTDASHGNGTGGLWQDSWNQRTITQPVDHCLALDYTVQNPVRSGLAAEWRMYAWNFSRFHADSPWRITTPGRDTPAAEEPGRTLRERPGT